MSKEQREIRTSRREMCFLCAKEGEVVYTGLVDRLFSAPGIWSFRRCQNPNCGLLWLDPVPIAEDVPVAYQKYFTHHRSEGAEQGSPLRRLLYWIYQVGSKLPATLAGLQNEKKRLSQMFLTDLNPGRVLDVGCGDGVFLNRMRKLGWTVQGVDFDERAIEHAKTKYGLELRHGDVHSAGFESNSFDAVTLSHVIEHLLDPGHILRELKRILKTGGRLVLTTPNSGGAGHTMFQVAWWGLDPPRHVQVFNLASLRTLAEQHGFKNICTFSTAANADIFIGGSYSIRSSAAQRINYEPRPSLSRTVRAVWAQYREHSAISQRREVGEEAVLICEKGS